MTNSMPARARLQRPLGRTGIKVSALGAGGHHLGDFKTVECRVLIGFNSGVYQDIDLSEWIASNPPDVLATNFSKPAALFEKFPREDVFITDKV